MTQREKLLAKGYPPEEVSARGIANTLKARMSSAYFTFLEEFEATHGRPPDKAEDMALSCTAVAYGQKQHQLVTEFKAAHHRSLTEEEYQPLCRQTRAYAERFYQLLREFEAAHDRNVTDEEYDALSEQASAQTEPRADRHPA